LSFLFPSDIDKNLAHMQRRFPEESTSFNRQGSPDLSKLREGTVAFWVFIYANLLEWGTFY
jgi:hypothetical protein